MRLLLTGASGHLGAYLRRAAPAAVAWHGRADLDLTDAAAVARRFAAARPDVVLHAAALARVADCHRTPDDAARVNVGATATLAALCRAAGARLVLVSTDMVFDGEHAPYREGDAPTPLSVYGRTKAEAERVVLGGPRDVVVRVGLLTGPSLTGRPSFYDEQTRALREGRPLTLFADEWRTPLAYAEAAAALLAVARSPFVGLLHVGGPERLSRLEMGRRLARELGVDGAGIAPARRAAAPAAEPRPRDLTLDSSRWRALRLPAPARGAPPDDRSL